MGYKCSMYEAVGLDYRLTSTSVLFNKWLTLTRMGETKESAVVLQMILDASPPPELEAMLDTAIRTSGDGCNPYSLASLIFPSFFNVS
jgi:hypothetical protein